MSFSAQLGKVRERVCAGGGGRGEGEWSEECGVEKGSRSSCGTCSLIPVCGASTRQHFAFSFHVTHTPRVCRLSPVYVCVCVRRNMRTWKTLSIVMKMTAQLWGRVETGEN